MTAAESKPSEATDVAPAGSADPSGTRPDGASRAPSDVCPDGADLGNARVEAADLCKLSPELLEMLASSGC